MNYDELVDWLERQPHIYGVTDANLQHPEDFQVVDFRIGRREDWYSDVAVIAGSSVSCLHPERDDIVTNTTLHLPPTDDSDHDAIFSRLDTLSDSFSVYNGSHVVDGVEPPPDGMLQPHIVLEQEVTTETMKETIGVTLDVYQSVYR